MESLRLFYALWPDDVMREALMRMQAGIRGRNTRFENLHLTLAFLGEQPADRLPALKKILANLPDAAISLAIDRIGYFKRNRIAWAGMRDIPNALTELYQCLTRQLAISSISFDSATHFRPHITLARDADPPEEFLFNPVAWQANRITLVQSLTSSEGVVYRVLASREMGNA